MRVTDYQRTLITDLSTVSNATLMNSEYKRRQMGTTTAVAIFLLWKAIMGPSHQTLFYVAPKLEHGTWLLNSINHMYGYISELTDLGPVTVRRRDRLRIADTLIMVSGIEGLYGRTKGLSMSYLIFDSVLPDRRMEHDILIPELLRCPSVYVGGV